MSKTIPLFKNVDLSANANETLDAYISQTTIDEVNPTGFVLGLTVTGGAATEDGLTLQVNTALDQSAVENGYTSDIGAFTPYAFATDTTNTYKDNEVTTNKLGFTKISLVVPVGAVQGLATGVIKLIS